MAAAPAKSPAKTPYQYLRTLDLENGQNRLGNSASDVQKSCRGALATASGLLFCCDDSGTFAAADAGTGAPVTHATQQGVEGLANDLRRQGNPACSPRSLRHESATIPERIRNATSREFHCPGIRKMNRPRKLEAPARANG